MKEKKKHRVLVEGPVQANFIADSIASHSAKTSIGAHDIFLGQVRNDIINQKEVVAIDYSAYAEMAEDIFHTIREEAFERFQLSCMHIYHSIGRVKAGEIGLFVFVSAPHRNAAFDACRWIVEQIKEKAPVWGKEIFADDTHSWKINT